MQVLSSLIMMPKPSSKISFTLPIKPTPPPSPLSTTRAQHQRVLHRTRSGSSNYVPFQWYQMQLLCTTSSQNIPAPTESSLSPKPPGSRTSPRANTSTEAPTHAQPLSSTFNSSLASPDGGQPGQHVRSQLLLNLCQCPAYQYLLAERAEFKSVVDAERFYIVAA